MNFQFYFGGRIHRPGRWIRRSQNQNLMSAQRWSPSTWLLCLTFMEAHLPKNFRTYTFFQASLVAQMAEHLPAMQETQVWSLSGEDPLEKEIAAHFSVLAWRIPWTEEPGRLQSMGSQRVGHDWVTSLSPPSMPSSSFSIKHWYRRWCKKFCSYT